MELVKAGYHVRTASIGIALYVLEYYKTKNVTTVNTIKHFSIFCLIR